MDYFRYPRLYEMIKCGCPFSGQIRERAISVVFEEARKELASSSDRAVSVKTLYSCVREGISKYFKEYPVQPVFKQRLHERVIAWIKKIEEVYCIQNEKEEYEDFPNPIQKDNGIELIKLLHSREGITKKAISEKLSVSTKTVQTDLRRLDSSLCEEESQKAVPPFRLGGHEMRVEIKCKEGQVTTKNGVYSAPAYFTPNTLHPLVMQLNVTQAAVLLSSLQQTYDSGAFGVYCLNMAMDIWCQLSDYCKERIKKIFLLNDKELSDFIEMIEDELSQDRYPTFQSEGSMIEDGDLEDQLHHAYKCGHLCTIVLKEEGKRRVYQKIRIFKNDGKLFEGYVQQAQIGLNASFEEEFQENRICFHVDDVISVTFE